MSKKNPATAAESFLAVLVVMLFILFMPGKSTAGEICIRILCFIVGAGALATWNECKRRVAREKGGRS